MRHTLRRDRPIIAEDAPTKCPDCGTEMIWDGETDADYCWKCERDKREADADHRYECAKDDRLTRGAR